MAGKRGISIIVVELLGKLSFTLQSRGVNVEDVNSLGNTSVPVERLSEIGIKFCPFCGVDLNSVVSNDEDYFRGLARENAHLSDASKLLNM